MYASIVMGLQFDLLGTLIDKLGLLCIYLKSLYLSFSKSSDHFYLIIIIIRVAWHIKIMVLTLLRDSGNWVSC